MHRETKGGRAKAGKGAESQNATEQTPGLHRRRKAWRGLSVSSCRHAPTWLTAVRGAAASHALAGRLDEARKYMARMPTSGTIGPQLKIVASPRPDDVGTFLLLWQLASSTQQTPAFIDVHAKQAVPAF